MEKFLFNLYSPKGEWYDSTNFLSVAPGREYRYTNAGATLLAFIIEKVSGESFDEYTEKNIFEPLGMNETHWSFMYADSSHFASLYLSNKTKIPHYSLITYPDGGLITSVNDLSKYLVEMIKGMNGESKLLTLSSFKEMMSNQLTRENFPDGNFELHKGLIWDVSKDGDNIGMNGADPGIFTYVLFTTNGNAGIIIFFNISFYEIESFEKDFKKIRNILMSNAGKFIR
ncbi:MAG TPA: serine hydrolase domain-containing protein [Ignavibacteria bacterium]|nr:serine hydrolase domain-containing protein [Ignavibacteria bacterium]